MSVDYRAALIYGYDCSNVISDFPWELRDALEEQGWDVISDCYDDRFLYIGVSISDISLGFDVRIDCEAEAQQSAIYLEELYDKLPIEIKELLPAMPSTFHICYAC